MPNSEGIQIYTVEGWRCLRSLRWQKGDNGGFPGQYVLKITRIVPRGRKVTFKLEGELLEPWVSSVREACASPSVDSEGLCLDMAAVTYVDAPGIELLRALQRKGVELAACSSYLTELLHLDE